MRHVRSPWLLALPLMAAGSLAAHALAYRLAMPNDHERTRHLELTGHSYLDHLPLLAALLAAPALLALGLAAFAWMREHSRPLGAGPFALLPPLAFVVQEHLERFAHSGAFPWDAALEPSFGTGLLLQAPFAFLAFSLARGLLAGASVLHRILYRPRRPRGPAYRRQSALRQWCLRRLAALAAGHAERGPPQATRS